MKHRALTAVRGQFGIERCWIVELDADPDARCLAHVFRNGTAYARVCSGTFERGDVLTHAASGKPFVTPSTRSRCSGSNAPRWTPRGRAM